MIAGAKITIFDGQFATIRALDVSRYIQSFDYAFDSMGCASATLNTNLTYEQTFRIGYFQGRNGIEISTADDQLQTACAAGATKLYVTNKNAYDVTKTLDVPQIAIDDGSIATFLIPVTGVGHDSGGDYITIGTPLSAPGNPTSLPAYGAGATIYRRRYAGRIALRTRANSRVTKMTFQCVGVSKRLFEALGTFTYNTVDIGTCIYQAILNFSTAGRFPELTVSAANFPTVGSTYAGKRDPTLLGNLINTDLLGAISTGDIWAVRVHADRVVRLVRLYTSTSNTYAYSATFDQHNSYFVPMDVQIQDEDISNLANGFQVVGDTDPVTKQPIRANFEDAASFAQYGQIDADALSNTAIKDVTTAVAFATSVANQEAFPQMSGAFKIYIRNDASSAAEPASNTTGLSDGDQLYGFEEVLLTGFDASDVSINKIPDPGLNMYLPGVAVWNFGAFTAAASPAITGAPSGLICFQLTGNGTAKSATANSATGLVVPGQKYTLYGYADATHSGSSGTVGFQVVDAYTNTVLPGSTSTIALGTMGRTTPVTFTIPSTTTRIRVQPIVVGCTIPSGQTLSLVAPMLSLGIATLPWSDNVAAPSVYGLPSSVVCHMDAGGDRYQTINFQPVEPNINAVIAETANAMIAQQLATMQGAPSIDSYCVSSDVLGLTFSNTSLVVNFPNFLALFAKGTNIVTVLAANVTLPASTNAAYVWVGPTGSFTVKANDPTPVAGAIMLAYFTTSATGVLGDTVRANIGLFKIGVGNVNFASNLPAPTFAGTPSVANGDSLNGIAADIVVTGTLNNVPQDQSAYGIQFYWRLSGGNGQWNPYDGINLSGLPSPPASQAFSFQYGDMTNGATYDFAIGYVGIAGYGPLTIIASSFVAQTIAIPGSYLLGTLFTPTLSGITLTQTVGAIGLTSNEKLEFTITNQPTDGSLARIAIWFRVTGKPIWTPVTSVKALAGASGAYTGSNGFVIDGLQNGTSYDFGVSGINTQNADGGIATIATNVAAAAVGIPVKYQLGGTTITPTLSGTPSVANAPTLQGMTARVGITFTVTNQPTDGSLSRLTFWYRATGTNWSAAFSQQANGLPTPTATQAYYMEIGELQSGVAYDFGISYEDAQGNDSNITSLATNYTAQAIGIPAPYLLGGGSALTPTCTTPSLSSVISANGLAASVLINVSITNQPTDGSLSRVNFWYRLSSQNNGVNTVGAANFNWQPSGGVPAVGVGSGSPPSTGGYHFTVDVSAELAYDYAVSMEDCQGNESVLGVLQTNYTAQVVNLQGIANTRTTDGATGSASGPTSGTQYVVGTFSVVLPTGGTYALDWSYFIPCTFSTASGTMAIGDTISAGTTTNYIPGVDNAYSTRMAVAGGKCNATGGQTISVKVIVQFVGSGGGAAVFGAGIFQMKAVRIS